MSVSTKDKMVKLAKAELKDDLVFALENAHHSLSDDDIKAVLNSILEIGWKQADGTWRKL